MKEVTQEEWLIYMKLTLNFLSAKLENTFNSHMDNVERLLSKQGEMVQIFM